jgi:hypothetical protein
LSSIIKVPAPSDRAIDPATGFGDWEEVVIGLAETEPEDISSEEICETVKSKEDLVHDMKEAARLGRRLNDSDMQIIDRSREKKPVHNLDEGHPSTQFKRVITKKPRRIVDSDD